jgi:hypothetical protein
MNNTELTTARGYLASLMATLGTFVIDRSSGAFYDLADPISVFAWVTATGAPVGNEGDPFVNAKPRTVNDVIRLASEVSSIAMQHENEATENVEIWVMARGIITLAQAMGLKLGESVDFKIDNALEEISFVVGATAGIADVNVRSATEEMSWHVAFGDFLDGDDLEVAPLIDFETMQTWDDVVTARGEPDAAGILLAGYAVHDFEDSRVIGAYAPQYMDRAVSKAVAKPARTIFTIYITRAEFESSVRTTYAPATNS